MDQTNSSAITRIYLLKSAQPYEDLGVIRAYKSKQAAEKAKTRLERRQLNYPEDLDKESEFYWKNYAKAKVFYDLLPEYIEESDTYYYIQEVELVNG